MENTKKQTKKRAVNIPGNEVGKQRYDIYRYATVWVETALRQGYNLEAITLIESLISDRLESRLSQLLGQDFSYKTLGGLIITIKDKETDEKLRALVLNDLDPWRNDRNSAMHEMVKLADGDTKTWQDRMDALVPVANRGYEIYRKIATRVRGLKKFIHKNGF